MSHLFTSRNIGQGTHCMNILSPCGLIFLNFLPSYHLLGLCKLWKMYNDNSRSSSIKITPTRRKEYIFCYFFETKLKITIKSSKIGSSPMLSMFSMSLSKFKQDTDRVGMSLYFIQVYLKRGSRFLKCVLV